MEINDALRGSQRAWCCNLLMGLTKEFGDVWLCNFLPVTNATVRAAT